MRASLVVLALLSFPPSASAFELRKDSQGDVVRWRREVVFVMDRSLGQALGEPRVKEAVLAAIAEIDEATAELAVRLEEAEVDGPGFELGGANRNVIVALDDWPYTDHALASTVVTLNARTDEILDTDIVFNVEQHTFRVLDGPAMRGDLDDVQNTLTHELGHALGLMHNPIDQRVVMYPRAAAGEIGKRVLQDDDRQGLAALYGEPLTVPEAPVSQVGCSTAGGAAWWVAGLLVALVLARRPSASVVRVVARRSRGSARRLGLLVGLVGAGLVAGRAEAQERSPVMTAVVRAKVSHRSATHPGLIVTSLDVQAVSCVGAAPCERQVRVTVPGGRLGDLEQIVEHHPVPALGETLGLAQRRGRWLVYRLADRDEAARFEALLTGSSAPQSSPTSPGVTRQPAAVVK
ncbi:MAG: matrixin family metalloprotease [Myxococcaceae bacterium]|nr:matrixin family metalloprotease [Myxococcaceae bacterium]